MSATKGCFATLTFYEENDTTFAGCVVIITDHPHCVNCFG